MVLIISMIAFILVTALFVLDASRDQELSSETSTYLQPFFAETIVKHNYSSTPDLVWGALTQLADYNFWFPGILRILPIVETDRYVHKYSFDQFQFAPGSEIQLRPFSLSPTYKGQITAIEKNKKLAFEMRFNPLHKETIIFSLEPSIEGTAVTCQRTSRGLFSWLSLWGFSNKSKILDNLGYFIPEQVVEETESVSSAKATGPQFSREAIIARAVQAGLDGNMDLVNEIADKPTRGMAKAVLVQAKRKGNIMPEHLLMALKEEPTTVSPVSKTTEKISTVSGGDLPPFENKEDLIAYVVNNALDGNEEPLSGIADKPTRGKAKAMLVKIKRGSLEKPAMPEIPVSNTPQKISAQLSNQETTTSSTKGVSTFTNKDDIIAYVVNKALDGDEEPLKELTDKLTRGKAKAMLVKIKRGSVEKPAMPLAQGKGNNKADTAVTVEKASEASEPNRESDEDLINRLVIAGVSGTMDEINALENKVLRGKIKAAVLKVKKSK